MDENRIRAAIRKAKAVFVCVHRTEFWIRIAKTEALELCKYRNWDMDCDTIDGDLHLNVTEG